MGGTASVLANYITQKINCKVRAIELSLLQRCAAHCASKTDVEESFLSGQTAVQAAVRGETDKMVAFKRAAGKEYKCEIVLLPLDQVANTEKRVPAEWITPAGNYVTDDFVKYALPLIAGESSSPKEDGLPRFARLKKVLATK